MRVGIFPGSFDPIHEGHIAFACAVGKQLNLDKIFFLVEPRPRRKQGVRALEHRIAMTQAAIANDKHLGVIVLEESRFAIDSTWPKIVARFGSADLYMIMGEANLEHIMHWPQLTSFVESAPSFVIGIRDEAAKPELQDTLHTLQKTKAFPFIYHITEQPMPKIHSRAIRLALKKKSSSDHIPAGAMEYMTKNKLYISGAT